ncbi:phospho-N-acetylmuramoyl-pentapeptide-transferase [Prochlorococcus marinus]|uniref:phospho-N-acetylmuramoyl-pentapeptide- transferase n=1 Tax=Prochlorococcus marinus TaxID=1219 RepID=UPI0022B4866E|nr:phospho-N-acetylmuramoyl-pentapeptide-transferase [Prochlorococcus marinus]
MKSSVLFIPLLISFIISTLIIQLIIPKLEKIKLHQIIRIEGPKKHHEKSGTPTMGGILIIPIGIIIGNLANLNNLSQGKLLAISFLTLGYMSIGLIDDWRSLTLNKNKGLTPIEKIFLQTIMGIIFIYFISTQGWLDSNILLFSQNSINLSFLIWPIALFTLIAESNATNLTDGLDGLASGCGAIVFTGLAIELILRGEMQDYSFARFAIALAGTLLGFLMHNRNPARIFMGDAGSLAIGGALTGIALITNSLWSLLIMGGVFVAEAISVIIQVGVYKISKRLNGQGYRIFAMAPLHHHFELKNKKELEIVKSFWLVSIFLVCLGLILRSRI